MVKIFLGDTPDFRLEESVVVYRDEKRSWASIEVASETWAV